MTAPVIYLDTNHISHLARNPQDVAAANILALLHSGSVDLAFSVLHMVELSDPNFKSFPDVCRLLDSVRIAWAILPHALNDLELEIAFARAFEEKLPEPRAFFASPKQALNYPFPDTALPSDALEAMREIPRMRDVLLNEATDHAREYDQVKNNAVAVTRPSEPLLSRIRDYILKTNPAGAPLAREFIPDSILERAGGLKAFPAYAIHQGLIVSRLKDPKYVTERNTIMDEWHAVYAPYVAAMALDRATAQRFRSMKLPAASRVTAKLHEIPALLTSLPEEADD